MVPESAKASLDRGVRIVSGVQASGRLHVGNYYGAVQRFMQLQNDGEALYFIANLHSLSTIRDAHALREYTLEAALAHLSLGLDPSKAILFRAKERGHAPGILKLPTARLPERAAVVPGADGQKMAKSAGNTIELFATDAEVQQQIMGIRTDPAPLESPKPLDNPLYGLPRCRHPLTAASHACSRAISSRMRNRKVKRCPATQQALGPDLAAVCLHDPFRDG